MCGPKSVVLTTGPSHMSALALWLRMTVPLSHGCRAWIVARGNKLVIVTKKMCLALAKKWDIRLEELKPHQL